MSGRIVIIDYGTGNHFSVQKKLKQLNCEVITSHDPAEISRADKLVLPGVGHFGKAMENLRSLNLTDVLNEQVIQKQKPILGICLGMQLMATHSEEGDAEGLQWIEGNIKKFDINDPLLYKVPHTGWNQIEVAKSSPLLHGLSNSSEFYFVHAYHFHCAHSEDILCYTDYETRFVSAVQRNNIFGAQFHPEKSHDAGLQLFKNFIAL
ncbi:MAG: imidazole glycerol phosphate synthase subunit HisH [Flavobacteriales bacterium]|nr:imidazole glycerol phosphate synthase subunit HisH [Flavobacteriales bacterium]